MGLFTKHSTTHFVRDKNGKVIATTKTGYEEKKTVWDRLAQNRQANKEVRQKERQERRYENKYQRQQEKEAYKKSYNEARIQRRVEEGRRAGQYHPISSFIPPRRVVHVHVGKKQSHGLPMKKKHRITPGEFQNNIMKKWGW